MLKQRLANIQAEKKTLAARQKEIHDEQVRLFNANEGKMSDDDRQKYDSLKEEFLKNKENLAQLDADEAEVASLLAQQEEVEKFKPTKVKAGSNPAGGNVGIVPDPSVSPEGDDEGEVALVPNCSVRHPANTLIVVKKPKLEAFSGEIGGLSAHQRAFRAGSYVIAVLSQQMPGVVPQKIASQCVNFVNDYMVYPHDNSGFDGFVPEEFVADSIILREKYGVARQLLEVVNMSSETKRYMKWVSGMSAQFVSSTGTVTNSEPQYKPINLVAKKIKSAGVFSDDLSADSIADIGDKFMMDMNYAFAIREDQAAFNGDGSDTGDYGNIYGIIPLLKVSNHAGVKATSQTAWTSITDNDIDDLFALLPSYAEERDNVVLVCHKKFYWTVLRPLTLAAGGSTKADVENEPGYQYNGVPVVFSQVMPSVTPASSSVTDIPLLLGDFRMAGVMGDRQSMQFKFTDQATVGSINTFDEDQIGIKATERIDVNWVDSGDTSAAGSVVGLKITGP